MEWSLGDVPSARRLFNQGTAVPKVRGRACIGRGAKSATANALPRQMYQHPPLYEAWGKMEAEAGDAQTAARLQARAQALVLDKQSSRGARAGREIPAMKGGSA